MTIIKSTAEPGSPEWHGRRQKAFNASDVGAAMGCDPNKTRTQLLHELFTGLQQEFSDYVRSRVIEPGHRIEALARPIAEQIIEDDLQVIGAARDFGLSRPLGASMDGLTFLEDPAWECKRANDELRAALPHAGRDSADKNDPAAIPKAKRAQMAQQQLVFGHTRTLFTVADFDAAGNVIEERHCWYHAEPELQREVLATWKQIDADLAAYVPPGAPPVPVVAQPVQALPAVTVQVTGSIAVTDNFKAFEVALRDFLEHRLIREPKTDQDFADLDLQIKAMKGAEAALENAEGQMLAQLASVDAAKKTKDMLHKLVRDNRLMAEKLLASEKERRRGEIVAGGIATLREHVAKLNERLGKPYMPTIAADFAGAIKGKRDLSSMENAVATELARAKIVAHEAADRIEANLKALREHAKDHAFLFADTATLVLKAPEDCMAVITARISEHKAAEERRLEAERERIRQEEAARLEREQAAQQAAEAQRQADAARPAAAAMAPPAPPAALTPPAPSVVQMPARAAAPAAPAGPPTLKLGEINARLAPHIATSEAGLAALGFEATKVKGACMYHEQDWPAICDAIVTHVQDVRDQRAAA
jgi:predicted phage-related endonuclease